jgi:uncharacterized delta-60 repeat protein
MTFDRNVPNRIFFGLLFLVGIFAVPVVAQSVNVDPTFIAGPSQPLPSNTNFQHVIQPDGKILVYNAPSMLVNGVARSGMFRLNSDGTTDTTFSYCNCGGVGISNVMVAPDGKIVLAGATSPNHAKMIRLNSDGSIDGSFSVLITAVGPPEITGNWLTVNAIQSDGKVIATHTSWGNIQGTWYSYSMKRYNLDATIDSSFSSPPLEGGHLVSTSTVLDQLPDGRFYLAITSRSHLGGSMGITRRLVNGAADPTYAPFSQTIFSSLFLFIGDLSIASDGGVLATGALEPTGIGFPPREQLRRFLPDGSSAPGFVSPLAMTGGAVHQLSDGKILYSASGGTVSRPLIRLEAIGSVDDTYVLDPVVTSIANKWQADAMGRPIFLAQTAVGPRFVRLLENGSIDPSFNPNFGAPSFVNTLAVQGDGKVILAGPFNAVSGVARGRIGRVNADGSLDASFDPGTGFNQAPAQLVVQPDGRILAAGGFSSYNGTAVPGIVRINSNGSIDNTFSVTTSNPVASVALQPDGKIFIGGPFTTVNGVNRTGVARLESSGALDTSFDVVLGVTPSIVQITVESSGKVLIGGTFAGVNGQSRDNLARLESNGALDATFNAGSINSIVGLWRQSDGKYIARSGSTGTIFGRRNNDGSPDATFTPPTLAHSTTPSIRSVLPLPDGGMLIGGRFTTVNGYSQNHISRLGSTGTLDTFFMPNGATGDVLALAWYPGGKVMVGGEFASIDTVSRLGIGRLNASVLQRSTPFDFDGDGRADLAVFRPSTNVWYRLITSNWQVLQDTFGLSGDIVTPGDFDGDGKTDLAIYRPSDGAWWYAASTLGGAHRTFSFGINGDIPRPSDFDGDGKTDGVLYRPSNNTWYRRSSSGQQSTVVFGAPGDQPVVGDFDGDGKSDPAVFRPSTGDWWYAASSAANQHRAVHWGQTGDLPAPADFDGDGKTDFAVFRPSEGGWYIFNSSNGSFLITTFGLAEDRPIPADYDGDGKADIAVFRPSTGIWYLLQSTSGFGALQWGLATDVAIPNSFVP